MRYIKVWCEYDIGGDFGGNNNETIFSVSDELTVDQIDQLVEARYEDLWEEVNEGEDETFLESGLLGWDYTFINELN